MKHLLTALAIGALLVGTSSISFAQESHRVPVHGPEHGPGGGGRPGGGGHEPFPGGGHEPFPGGGHDPFPGGPGRDHDPGRWHGPEHNWGGWGDRHVFHGAWFWFGPSVVLLWDGAEYVETTVFFDPATGLYYWVDGAGVSHWLN
jgi:hypothetical protein